jgi:hypothetical protein
LPNYRLKQTKRLKHLKNSLAACTASRKPAAHKVGILTFLRATLDSFVIFGHYSKNLLEWRGFKPLTWEEFGGMAMAGLARVNFGSSVNT